MKQPALVRTTCSLKVFGTKGVAKLCIGKYF